MDVKFGNGAFMASREDAQALADSIVEVAAGAGLPTRALLTPMDQPLASVAGNALEVAYAIDLLTGAHHEQRMLEVTVALGAAMLVLAGVATDDDAGRSMVSQALAGGAAAERFGAMVTALGGPADLLEQPRRHLAAAEVVVAVAPERPGSVVAVDTRAVGLAVVALGGGRTRPQDTIDPAVGLTALAAIGDDVDRERPLGVVHARTTADADAASRQLRAAYQVGDGA
jgi:thymidine phosphorylase